MREAIEIARQIGDDALLITCATGWTPTWSSGLPFARKERVQLLEAATAGAKADDERAILLGRLATEMLYTSEGARARPLADEALIYAERSGDRRTRIEVQLRHFDATWSPHFLDARRAQIASTLCLAEDADIVDRCFSLSRSAAAAIEAADLAAADDALGRLFDIGARHDLSVVTHAVTAIRAWRTGLAGDLAEAERLVNEADQLGRDAQLHNVAYGSALQLFCLSWARGRFVDLLPVLELGYAEDRVPISNRVMLSRALAAAGRRDEARGVIDSVSDEELESLTQDALWSMVLIAAAEAAYMIGAERVGGTVHRLLVPFASRVAFARNWVVAPIAFGAGMASAAAGCADTDDLFQESLEISERLDAPILRARTQIAWVRTALDRPNEVLDREQMRAHVEDARTVFADHRLEVLHRSTAGLVTQVTP